MGQPNHPGWFGWWSYLRALPDIGQGYEDDELDDSPQLTYPIYTSETADYTVWVRAMATGDAHIVHLNSIADQQVLLKPALNLEDTNDNESHVPGAR